MDPMDIFTQNCWRHLEVYIPWSLAAPMQELEILQFYPVDVSEFQSLNFVMKWLQHWRFIELACLGAQQQAVAWGNSIYRKPAAHPTHCRQKWP